MIPDQELIHIRKAAESIAIGAGTILLNWRGKARILKSKKDALDIVTEADKASETYIISELKKIFPTHSFFSEESGKSTNKSHYRWVIDPLDGTKEFSRGLFLFCVNIALEYKGKIIIGVVYLPATNEIYSTSLGQGTTFCGKKVKISDQDKLSQSMVVVHPPRGNLNEEKFTKNWQKVLRVSKIAYRMRALSSDIFSLAWISQGAYEAFYCPIAYPNWWDIAPGLLMVTESGGKLTTAKGNKLDETSYQEEGILATNGKIHPQFLKLINDK